MISVEVVETMIDLSLAALEATAGQMMGRGGCTEKEEGVKEEREGGGRSDGMGEGMGSRRVGLLRLERGDSVNVC